MSLSQHVRQDDALRQSPSDGGYYAVLCSSGWTEVARNNPPPLGFRFIFIDFLGKLTGKNKDLPSVKGLIVDLLAQS